MNADQFIQQLIQTGTPVHRHQGTWWKRHRPFFFKPAVQYQAIMPESSQPSPWRSLIGYSHVVPPGEAHNAVWPTMIVDWPADKTFSMENLAAPSAEKRSQIRRQVRTAFKELDIRPIDSLDGLLDDLQEINISAAHRTAAGLPPGYYERDRHRWESHMRMLFSLPDREWWGAFLKGKLIAYYYGYAVGGEWIIDTAKSTTEYLHCRPNDGLLFRVMESAINTHHCTRINYGGWTEGDPRLTQFKQKHGFKVVLLPVALRISPLVSLLLKASRKKIYRPLAVPAEFPAGKEGEA